MSEKEIMISVVIPAFNSEKYICRAIDSVLAQTYAAYEIIVVDDGSTDGTSSKVASYGEKVKYIYQENAGPGAARNHGITVATGNWISFLDSDDIYLPKKLELGAELLKNNPELVWCAGYYDKCLKENYTPGLSYTRSGSHIYGDYFRALLKGDYVCTITVLVKKEVLLDCGLFRTDINYGEDTDLWWRIGYSHHAYGHIYDPVAVYYMNVPGSLARKRQNYQDERDFIKRNIEQAKLAGAWDRFRPIAIIRVKDWIRGAKFDERAYDIRNMVKDFSFLLGFCYKLRMTWVVMLPGLSMKTFQLLSKLNRKYKIRKKIIHPKD